MEKAIDNIPTHTIEQIESHCEWYEQYIVLREKKRQAIRHWKSNKLVSQNFLWHHKKLPGDELRTLQLGLLLLFLYSIWDDSNQVIFISMT